MRWRDPDDTFNLHTIPKPVRDEFYKSPEWKVLRKKVLEKLNRSCAVCGCKDHLVVDHIKPARYYWKDRLNEDNLQILCNYCNLEKSNIVGWTLEWHIKNKEELAEQRRSRQRLELSRKQDESLPQLYDLMSYEEYKEYVKAYSLYRKETKRDMENRVFEYEFARYIIYKSLVVSEFNLMNVVDYVKENYNSITADYVDCAIIDNMMKEKALKKKEKEKIKKNIVKRITKDGKVIEYEKTKNGLIPIGSQ